MSKKQSKPEDVRIFRTQFDITYRGSKGKSVDSKTQTIPDLTLSVRQLLQNHTRGNASNVKVHDPLWFDIEIPQIRDITDIEKYREKLEEALKQTEDFIIRERLDKKKAAEEEKEVKDE